jgi:hypothetical protein
MYVLDVVIYILKKFLLDNKLGDIQGKEGEKDETGGCLKVSDTERDEFFIDGFSQSEVRPHLTVHRAGDTAHITTLIIIIKQLSSLIVIIRDIIIIILLLRISRRPIGTLNLLPVLLQRLLLPSPLHFDLPIFTLFNRVPYCNLIVP